MKKQKSILIGIILGGLLLALFCFDKTYGLKAHMHALVWKMMASPAKEPLMYQTPKQLVETNTTVAVTTFTNSICSFSTPWADPEVLTSTNDVVYFFSKRVGIFVSLDNAIYAEAFNLFRKHDEAYRILEPVFRANHLYSNYDFLQACLNSTPNQLSMFNSREQTILLNVFMPMKLSMTVTGHESIFSFEFDEFRGFQFGDPTKDGHLMLVCFSSPDTAVQIDINRVEDFTMSQSDINCILDTLKMNANQGMDFAGKTPVE